MLSQIKTLYKELESIDLNLLVSVQNRALHDLSYSLRERERQLKKIGMLLEDIPSQELAERDQDDLLSLQDGAVCRNQRIIAEIRNLCTTTQQEFIKCRASGPKSSPYTQRKRTTRRLKA